MRVEVRLYATLAAWALPARPGTPSEVELPDSASLESLIAQLRIDPASVHLVIVNGRILHDRTARLTAGDRVALFPPVGGG